MIPASLEQYRVYPATPRQEFAGVPHAETLFLAFPDEQTAIAALTEAGLCRDGAMDGSVDTVGEHGGLWLVNVVGLV